MPIIVVRTDVQQKENNKKKSIVDEQDRMERKIR